MGSATTPKQPSAPQLSQTQRQSCIDQPLDMMPMIMLSQLVAKHVRAAPVSATRAHFPMLILSNKLKCV